MVDQDVGHVVEARGGCQGVDQRVAGDAVVVDIATGRPVVEQFEGGQAVAAECVEGAQADLVLEGTDTTHDANGLIQLVQFLACILEVEPAQYHGPEARNAQMPTVGELRCRHFVGPGQDGVEVAGCQHVHDAAVDQVIGALFTLGGQGMLYRLDEMAFAFEPQAGAVVEGRQVDGVELALALAQEGRKAGAGLGAFRVQPTLRPLVQVAKACHHALGETLPEVLAEQGVEAIPLFVVVQRHQQQAICSQAFEHVLGIPDAQHLLAEFHVEPIQHGKPQQQVLGVPGQVAQGALQDGFRQGIEAFVPVRQVRILQLVGHRQHLDTGDPAFGGLEQGPAGFGAHRDRHALGEEGLGFAFGETQAADIELVATALLARLLQARGQFGAGGDDQVEVGGRVFHHAAKQFMNARIVYAMVVVEDQVELVLELREHVDQHGQEVVQGLRTPALIGVHQLLRDRAVGLLQGRDPIAEELAFLTVAFVQVDPADLVPLLDKDLSPLRQQGGLAEAPWRPKVNKALVGHVVQAIEQTLTQQRGVVVTRGQELGDQHGLGPACSCCGWCSEVLQPL
ncbi:hypothetical protein D9M70_395590 [compost metagenome]